ncbi:helix-turn-helix domain-containing protein [Streptomyces sp. SID3343]|uniref:telomere-associated protein Tap n=1 Tax=Streptomyces sp. SID3343 TaxID=2690260 RepID=UPI00136948D0|nr:helix-turn-helix domain-containing protein [Streptomyces sp. SID3343]MYW00374.1 helix-turn-helix domain-containing protein [Streptomyces sp. SID3343]
MSELFDAVDALLEEAALGDLPVPAERARLRKAAGLSQQRVANALGVQRVTVVAWEAGRTEPRPPQRQAYARLLAGLADRYPALDPDPTPAPDGVEAVEPDRPEPAPDESDEPEAAAPPADPAPDPTPSPAVPTTGAGAPVVTAAAPWTRTPTASPAAPTPSHPVPADRRAPAGPASPSKPAGAAAKTEDTDTRAASFPAGPLAVLDVDTDTTTLRAHLADDRVLPCPAKTLPAVVAWALDAGLGAQRLHRAGRDADPLIVVTPAAAESLGLPAELEDRRNLRLPEDHTLVKQVTKNGWKLTRRGFGPWTKVYRPPADGGRRLCVQFAFLGWDALDPRSWAGAADLPAPELAALLGTYAARVVTPRGSTAVAGLTLMTELRPPTQAVKDEATGTWRSGPVPGSLTDAVDPAPPEAPDEHPVAQTRDGADVLVEEAYDWHRPLHLVGDDEGNLDHAVGIDVNAAFLAAASRLPVGLGPPVHVQAPTFDKKLPGCWYVDLSTVKVDPRLPNPFTPNGTTPTGPGWYATPTVAYALELGATVDPFEAWIRPDHGPYLDPWYTRLRDAYLATMADLGVTPDLDDTAFLHAMSHHKQVDPARAIVLSAIKATVKGGIGKLRERPQGARYKTGDRWPALERPTWRPDIRAAVIANARVGMHRKMRKLATAADLYPLAVLSDCVVYPSAGPSPLDVLPRTADGKPIPGAFRLGVSPGMVKHEGTRPLEWALGLLLREQNPARHIKDGVDAVAEGE